MNFGMCGRWRNGRLVNHCTMAGTEECDFECPYRDAPDDVEEQADAEPAASGVPEDRHQTQRPEDTYDSQEQARVDGKERE